MLNACDHKTSAAAPRAALVSAGATALLVVMADALAMDDLVTALVSAGGAAAVCYQAIRLQQRRTAMIRSRNREVQRQFIGDASHELRNPLAIIMAALELAHLYPNALDDELSSGALLHEARRMQTLVEDLLLLARADDHDLSLTMSPVELDVLAREAAKRLDDKPGLDVLVHADAVTVHGDVQALSRTLDELLDNASRHATTLVEICVTRNDTAVVLSVGDDGPGISPAQRLRAMQRFVRLDADRSRDRGGTGLGLSVASEIVAAHGGTVVLGDRRGGGTTATVSLPAS